MRRREETYDPFAMDSSQRPAADAPSISNATSGSSWASSMTSAVSSRLPASGDAVQVASNGISKRTNRPGRYEIARMARQRAPTDLDARREFKPH